MVNNNKDDEYADSSLERKNKVIKLVAMIALGGLIFTTAITMGISQL